jgi:hypothetical protein
MIIDLVLGGLCIFTDMWSDAMGQGQYIEEEVLSELHE